MQPMLPVVFIGASLGACGGAAIPEPPERVIYLAIGASDAAGVGANPLTRGYVFRIADELDDRVDQVFLAPLAIPGATAGQLDGALELFLESEIEPNLVTVWTGPNDVIRGEDADEFEDATAAAARQAFVRLASASSRTVPPLSLSGVSSGLLALQFDEYETSPCA